MILRWPTSDPNLSFKQKKTKTLVIELKFELETYTLFRGDFFHSTTNTFMYNKCMCILNI
ncbi:hypothetical protein HanIR_Chr17g0881871 [Helianthus annuus]|nr:hypothetical protein HanIR_Chr17g0881871 [Helianthus annuus]